MHARTIPTLLLFSALLGRSPAAQQPPSQDPLAAEMTALLLEQVKGDAAAAEAEVSKALARAAAKDRPRLLLRRVLLLEKLGRATEAQATLAQLTQEPAPFGPWAAARLGTPPAAVPGAATDPSAPLVRLVAALDQDENQPMVSRARNELRKLGPLAVPAMLAQLDKLELFGLRNVLDLLAVYPDMGIVPALERLLAGADQPVRQLTAAQALIRLPLATRKPLALRLLEGTQGTWLRLAALAAVAEDPAERNRLTAECARMNGSDARAECGLLHLLAQHPQPGNAEVLRFLESRATGSDQALAQAALAAVAPNLGDDGEGTALALLDRIPRDERSRGFFEGLWRRRGPVWPRARVRELSCFPTDISERIKLLRADGIEPTAEELAGLLELQPAQEQWCREARSYALTTLTARKDKAGVPAALRLLGTEEDPYGVALYLIAAAPEELDPRVGALLARPLPSHPVGQLVRFARDRGLKGAVTPAIELLLRGGWGGTPEDALELVAQHSGPEHLAGVLDLARARQSGNYVQAACRALSRWFNKACIAPWLERLPTLAKDARNLIASKVIALVGPADATAVETALDRALAEPIPNQDRWQSVSMLITALGRAGGATAETRLRGLLLQDDPSVQVAAWQALRDNPSIDGKAILTGILQRKESIPFLPVLLCEPLVAQDEALRKSATQRLREATGTGECEEISRFLSRLPTQDRIALATECLDAINQGPESMGRLAGPALQTLGELRDEALVPVLAKGLTSNFSNVRQKAIVQIGNTFSLKAMPFLLEAMKDEDQANADLATKYIERIGRYLQTRKQVEDELKQAGK